VNARTARGTSIPAVAAPVARFVMRRILSTLGLKNQHKKQRGKSFDMVFTIFHTPFTELQIKMDIGFQQSLGNTILQLWNNSIILK